ncbi:MAG: MBL fold metallo-hydrolase [Candidatus Bathyarchaeota archaeon]|nr:MBL fold metallo-hydrolase [Candidatus Bathyarchaeota archaeon]
MRNNGIEVKYKDTNVILDPSKKTDQQVFITHAHGDHCQGFKSSPETYSTHATLDLAQVYAKSRSRNRFVELHKTIDFGEVNVKAHNSGHILGSAQYEITTPLGNVVYTGDINFRDTLVTQKAEVVPCDLLVIESTYGTPCYFPSRDYMYERIVKWATSITRKNKIPSFQTDALGNAQELIALLNKSAKIPVVTHPRVSGYSRIYGRFGHRLDFVDAASEEGKEIVDRGECALIAPKSVDLRGKTGLDVAFVSGWGSRFSGRRKAFSLSDHSDFYRLLGYVEEAKPKIVLTCHGSLKSKVTLATKIQRMLKIPSAPLKKSDHKTFDVNIGQTRHNVRAHVRELMTNIKPGFTYPRRYPGKQSYITDFYRKQYVQKDIPRA